MKSKVSNGNDRVLEEDRKEHGRKRMLERGEIGGCGECWREESGLEI
jgi:hypothetical protein